MQPVSLLGYLSRTIMHEQSYGHRDIHNGFPQVQVGWKLTVMSLHNSAAGGFSIEVSSNLGISVLTSVMDL